MISITKIKKFINENWDYFIGGIIGFFIALFPSSQDFTSKFVALNDIILYVPRKITSFMYDCVLCIESLYINLILTFLLYILLGISLVFLLRKINSSKKNKKK